MLTWTPHPILTVPTDEEIAVLTPEELVRLHDVREEAIRNSINDKFRYGWIFDNWRKVEQYLSTRNEALISGGNRSGKTQFGAYAVVKAAVENPNSDIFCFAQTAEVSIRQQQSAVYDWLPQEYKTKQTSSNTYISYKRKTGFTDNSLILPNGSRISFKTYAAYANNPTILEGAELGSLESTWLNLGVWLDEYLGGPEIIDTLRFRLATRNSKMILTFTPIFGMTDVVKQYVDGSRVLEKRKAELLENEEIPTILECKNIKGTVHYFWSEDNPWGGYPRIKETLIGKPRNEILVRAYGVATKSHHTKFPKFNKAVNVIKASEVPTKNVTRYHIIDPAGAKNWFMCWIAVDASGTFYVYREWPGVDVGDWAEWKGGKWVPGEGARGQGYGIRDYIELVRELEAGEPIFERLIDPRLGAAQYQAADGSSSIIEDLEENDMSVIPAPGLHIDDGLQALIGKMSWDTSKPMDSVNRPYFYVSEECENIIQGLSEYTGEQGLKEAWKDVIDCYDSETEVMSKDGWVRFADLEKGVEVATMAKDGVLEWQAPEYYIAKHYDGGMVSMQTQALDFVVTPTHRMVVHPQKTDRTVIREARGLFRQDTIPVVTRGISDTPIPMVEIYPGKWCAEDDWAEFLGWFVSEGCVTGCNGGKIYKSGRGHQVMISQCDYANPEKCRRLEALFERMGLNFNKRGNTYFLTRKALWEVLKPLGNVYNKRLPKEVFSFSRQSLERLFDAMISGDGWRHANGKAAYASVSKGLIDDLQMVMQLIGKAHGSIVVRSNIPDSKVGNRTIKATTEQYWLIERVNRASCITNRDKEYLPQRVAYSGMVYCVSVPNETLIVRRNGKVMVCGNCLRYAAIAGIDHVEDGQIKITRQGGGGY